MPKPVSAGASAKHLAANLRSLRGARQWTQAKLSAAAQVPRSSIAQMESGDGNPSLRNLSAVAGALRVSLEELLATPRPACTHIAAADLSVKSPASAVGVTVFGLLPERIHGVELDRIELAPKASMLGSPHLRGTFEYLHVVEGEMLVAVAGQRFTLATGDVLAFPGDCGHSYSNFSAQPAVGLSVVIPQI